MNIALMSIGFSKDRKEATAITLIDFARELVKKGHNVVIISEKRSTIKGILPEYEEIEGIKVYRKYSSLFFVKGGIMAQAKCLDYVQKKEGIKFDIIHNFSNAPIVALRGILARRYSKKARIIQTIKAKSGRLLGSKIFSFILNFADKVTTTTNMMKEELAIYGCDRRKIAVIRSHINTEKFSPLNKKSLKKKYGYKNRKVILYYGSVRIDKGICQLIDSIPEIVKENKNAMIIISPRNIPGYKALSYYKEHIEKLNKQYKENNLRIMDIIPEKIEEYVNLADLVALPYTELSTTEGNPSCLLESMACKTPVVTTDLPELKEIVADRKEVLMAKPGDAEDLANKVNELLKNKRLQKKLVKNAYKKSKEFDVRKITKEYLKIYKEKKK